MSHHAVGKSKVTKAAPTPVCSPAVCQLGTTGHPLHDTTLQTPVPLLTVKRQCVISIHRAESNPFFPNELGKKEKQKLNFLFSSRSVSTFRNTLDIFCAPKQYFQGRERDNSSKISAHTC